MAQQNEMGQQSVPGEPPDTVALALHHVGLQTSDLDNATAWYQEFMGCRPTWTLSTFSPLTVSRLPGIQRLAEVVVGNVRLHLFERAGLAGPPPGAGSQFQHVCVAVPQPADLEYYRERWVKLFESRRYTFALPDQPTEIAIDEAGVQSFYAFDVNGLEFEFTYLPEGALCPMKLRHARSANRRADAAGALATAPSGSSR